MTNPLQILYIISREARKLVTVALSGDGGDEVFGGYRKYLGFRWAGVGNLIPNSIRRKLSEILPDNKENFIGENSRRLRRFLETVSGSNAKTQMYLMDQMTEDEFKKLFCKEKDEIINILEELGENFEDPINAVLSMDLGCSLPADMLVKVDRMSMANSLEVRSPFLDKDLVEYAFSIPGQMKVGYLKGKKILRNSFSNRLPNWYLSLPKKGFEIPISNWLKSDLRHLVDEATNSKNIESMGFKNDIVFKNWKEDFFGGKRDNAWKLWTLISYYIWSKSNGYV